MFSLSESNKFMVCTSAVDLRKGVDPLSRMVRCNSMSPTDGSVYVFLNRTRTRMKLLYWERGGYVIFYKRMEQGRISHTVFQSDESCVFKQLRWDELVLLVEGMVVTPLTRDSKPTDAHTEIREAHGTQNCLPGCKAGNSLMASIVTDKFCDHLPEYRQANLFQVPAP